MSYLLISSEIANEKELVTDQPTKRPTDGPSYRDAWTHLKTMRDWSKVFCMNVVNGGCSIAHCTIMGVGPWGVCVWTDGSIYRR